MPDSGNAERSHEPVFADNDPALTFFPVSPSGPVANVCEVQNFLVVASNLSDNLSVIWIYDRASAYPVRNVEHWARILTLGDFSTHKVDVAGWIPVKVSHPRNPYQGTSSRMYVMHFCSSGESGSFGELRPSTLQPRCLDRRRRAPLREVSRL